MSRYIEPSTKNTRISLAARIVGDPRWGSGEQKRQHLPDRDARPMCYDCSGVRQRVQLGETESFGKVALRGGVGGEFTFVVPKFGATCVCCNAPAMGRTQDFDASTDRVQAPAVAMPVCFECRKHALVSNTEAILLASTGCVGVPLVLLAVMKLDERPQDDFLWGMLVVGGVLVVATIAWSVAIARRSKREARGAGWSPSAAVVLDRARAHAARHRQRDARGGAARAEPERVGACLRRSCGVSASRLCQDSCSAGPRGVPRWRRQNDESMQTDRCAAAGLLATGRS